MESEVSSLDLSWLPSDLEPVAMRLARVDEAAYDIADISSLWSLGEPIDFVQYRRGISYSFVVHSVRPIPPRVSLLFSEAINHLRAAIDNTIWHLVESAREGAIEGAAARQIAMPIHDSPERFDRWARGIAKQVPELGSTTALCERVRSLQPFEGHQPTIPETDEFLASMMGDDDLERAHPLLLLQAYSNADKHRAVRLANVRATSSRPDRAFWGQDRTFRSLSVGDVLHTGRWGEPAPMEVSPAVTVQRPEPFSAWAPPARELALLNRHVSDTVIPTLVTGETRERALTSSVELGDTGISLRERLQGGGLLDARARMVPVTERRYAEAMAKPVKYATVIDVEPGEDRGA